MTGRENIVTLYGAVFVNGAAVYTELVGIRLLTATDCYSVFRAISLILHRLKSDSQNSLDHIRIALSDGEKLRDFHSFVHRKLLFRASYECASGAIANVLVKLTSSYGEDVHKALGEDAPQLLKCEHKDGYIVVVMEEVVNAVNLDVALKDPDHFNVQWLKSAKENLLKIMTKMSSRNYVHGDLRPPNILVVDAGKSFKIIDFDWAGKVGKMKFPEDINKKAFAIRIEPFQVITQEHDEDLLEKHLFPMTDSN